MTRAFALALAIVAVIVGEAQATPFKVIVVPGLELADLAALEDRGAVGLLVPGAGPETSARLARAALVRGEVRNSLRDGLPSGPRLISIETTSDLYSRGPAILLGLPSGGRQANDRRYPIAVIGGGYEGVLLSDSTRIPGLVSIADVAPTVLGTEEALGSRAEDDATGELLALDRRIDENNDVRLPATLIAGALVVVLSLIFPRAALLGLAAGLLANLVLGAAGASVSWGVLLVIGLAVAAGGPLLALVLRSAAAVGALLSAVLLAYLVSMGLDGASVALSPLGPTQNARFYGISNLLATLLLVPAIAGAAFLSRRFGQVAFIAVAVLALATIAGSRFGADGGGAIVLVAGYAVLALLLANARKRTLAPGLVAGLALALALIGLDAAIGPSSHVTRALGDGPRDLARDLADRVALSYERTVSRWYVALLIGVGIVLLAALVVRLARRDLPTARRAVPFALAAAIAVSLVVNDSPNDVVLAGLVGYLAATSVILRDPCAAGYSSSSSPSSPPVAAGVRPSPQLRRPS
jgi:hypothetical protein